MIARCIRLLGFGLILVGAAQAADVEAPPRRKVLFLDLWKLDYWDNVELTQGEPEFLSEATYHDPAAPKSGVYFPSVWRDDASGKWRMVHSPKWSPFTLMAAESDDGVHWRPLPVLDAQPLGDKVAPHHLFTLPHGEGSVVYQDPCATDGYRFRIFARQQGEPVLQRALADPDHRWHAIARDEGGKHYLNEGVTLVSPDGLHWELKTGGSWDWLQDDWAPEPPVFAFWNHRRQEHTMVVRPGWGDRRQCLRTTRDLKEWSDPELLFQPDTQDDVSPIGFYGMPVHAVGDGAAYVGLLWVFRNSSSEPVSSFNQFFGVMDNELTYSYDGVRFNRTTRTPFLRRNPTPEYGCTQVRTSSIVERDEDFLIYSEGHRAEHGREGGEQRLNDEPLCGMIVHRLRKDGWMYLRSRGDWARIQTKPFTLFNPSIALNVSVPYGEVRFRLTDEKSQPLEFFDYEDCIPLRGLDTLAGELKWQGAGNPDDLIGQVLRLEIKFRNANLYAIEMAHHFIDAQDRWLLMDGKEIPAKLFDY
jgi:hypothetical protein